MIRQALAPLQAASRFIEHADARATLRLHQLLQLHHPAALSPLSHRMPFLHHSSLESTPRILARARYSEAAFLALRLAHWHSYVRNYWRLAQSVLEQVLRRHRRNIEVSARGLCIVNHNLSRRVRATVRVCWSCSVQR